MIIDTGTEHIIYDMRGKDYEDCRVIIDSAFRGASPIPPTKVFIGLFMGSEGDAFLEIQRHYIDHDKKFRNSYPVTVSGARVATVCALFNTDHPFMPSLKWRDFDNQKDMYKALIDNYSVWKVTKGLLDIKPFVKKKTPDPWGFII